MRLIPFSRRLYEIQSVSHLNHNHLMLRHKTLSAKTEYSHQLKSKISKITKSISNNIKEDT